MPIQPLRLAGAALTMGAALVVASCSASPGPSQAVTVTQISGAPIARTAQVNLQAGTILLPLDGIIPSDGDWRVLDYAQDLWISHCAKLQHVVYPIIDRRGESQTPSLRYGIWLSKQADSFAYNAPPQSKGAYQQEALNRHAWTKQQLEVIDDCETADEFRGLGTGDITTSQSIAMKIYEAVLASSKGQEVLNDWRKCITASGYSPNPQATDSPFVLGSSKDPGNHALAHADVHCKSSVNLVGRLSQMEAAQQDEFIRTHSTAVSEQSDRIRIVLQRARSLVARLSSPSTSP